MRYDGIDERRPGWAAWVAMAVGKTNDGESLPAKPSFVRPVPLSITTAGASIGVTPRRWRDGGEVRVNDG